MTAAPEVAEVSDAPAGETDVGHPLQESATALAEGMRGAARMVADNPGLMAHPGLALAFVQLLVSVSGDDAREAVSAFALAGAAAGGEVVYDLISDGTWRGITIAFGPLELRVFGSREQVGEKPAVDEPVDECDGGAP